MLLVDETKLTAKKRPRDEAPPSSVVPTYEQLGGAAGNSLYSLLKQEVAAEAGTPAAKLANGDGLQAVCCPYSCNSALQRCSFCPHSSNCPA